MIRKVHGTDFKEMKAGLIMKYWNFTRRILLTLFFTTAVCPGLSQAVLHVNAASDDCSVTIGDGETSFSLDHAAVDGNRGVGIFWLSVVATDNILVLVIVRRAAFEAPDSTLGACRISVERRHLLKIVVAVGR